MFELKELQKIRKKLGLTQSELAKQADVSQSLIAKIESQQLDPTVSKANKIFEAIENLTKKHELKAEQIMIKKIISIDPDSSIHQAVEKMTKYEISQLPVIEKDNVIGLVSESTILKAISEKKEKIIDIMEDSPPVISRKASLSVILELLKFYPLVLVHEQGKVSGLITKSDIIRNY